MEVSRPYFKTVLDAEKFDFNKVASILQQRVTKLTQIPDMVKFFAKLPEYDKDLFVNKKSKTNLENVPGILSKAIETLQELESWNHDTIHDALIGLAEKLNLKNGTVMWPVRIAASGMSVTPGGAIEILDILGKGESLKRLEIGLRKL